MHVHQQQVLWWTYFCSRPPVHTHQTLNDQRPKSRSKNLCSITFDDAVIFDTYFESSEVRQAWHIRNAQIHTSSKMSAATAGDILIFIGCILNVCGREAFSCPPSQQNSKKANNTQPVKQCDWAVLNLKRQLSFQSAYNLWRSKMLCKIHLVRQREGGTPVTDKIQFVCDSCIRKRCFANFTLWGSVNDAPQQETALLSICV